MDEVGGQYVNRCTLKSRGRPEFQGLSGILAPAVIIQWADIMRMWFTYLGER